VNSQRALPIAIEVVVIVASILLAFALDAWWDSRQLRVQETEVLERLQVEFAASEAHIEEWRAAHVHVMEAGEVILSQTGPNATLSIAPDSLGQLIWDFNWVYTVEPPDGVLSGLISSGQLGLISSTALRDDLANWPSAIRDLHTSEASMSEIVDARLVPYLDAHISWRSARHLGGYADSGPSSFPDDFGSVLRDREFENIVDGRVGYTLSVVDQYDLVLQTAARISTTIAAELATR